MVTVLIAIYTAIVLVLFKLKVVRPRPYPIALVALVGVFVIGGVVVAWKLSAPMSSKLVTTQYVVALVPYVKGQVKSVHAQANQPVKKGDLLLQIDPEPYQYTVNQREGQLRAAKANVEQAQAAAATAQAALNKAMAADKLAKTQEEIALNVKRRDVAAISTLKVAEATQQSVEASAAVQQAEASARQAVFAVEAARGNVIAIEGELADARFNLAQCKVTAPADGYVVNWQVQPGTMLVPAPVAAAGTFVSTEDISLIAVFPQNYLTYVQPGDDVEVVLDPYPGRLFAAKVDSVIPASGGGQFTTSGKIPNAAEAASSGAYAVKILFADETVARTLSMGSGGTAAVYTKRGKPVHVISKVTIRMKKWLLYVIPSVAA
jgi:multidrug resistance efflux pump